MTTTKKFSAIIATVLLSFLTPVLLFAIPGIQSPLNDLSGEYVFYRDYTFDDDTYIGFLQYDEGTVAIRIFSTTDNFSTDGTITRIIKNDITTYLRLDPDADYISIIGETTPLNLTDDQISTINYGHDMLYELASRRKHLNGLDLSTELVVSQEFAQFEKNVSLTWQGFVPLFNLRTINDELGDPLFEAVTIGTLTSSEDTSFQAFAGLDTAPSVIASKKVLDADAALDDRWVSLSDSIRSLDDQVLYSCMILDLGSAPWDVIRPLIIRNCLQSQSGTWVNLPSTVITNTSESVYIKAPWYSESLNGWLCSIKTIKPLDETQVFYQELSALADYYRQHSNYLETLLNR